MHTTKAMRLVERSQQGEQQPGCKAAVLRRKHVWGHGDTPPVWEVQQSFSYPTARAAAAASYLSQEQRSAEVRFTRSLRLQPLGFLLFSGYFALTDLHWSQTKTMRTANR